MTDAGETRKSKSQRKRDSLALQSLGEALTELTPNDLARVPMWPELEAAVADARGLRRALRAGESDPIAQALDAVRRPGRREAARHRRIERLRDALLRGEKSPDDMRAAVPGPDFQQLRHLVAAARRERERGDANTGGTAGERRLFRFLRDHGLDVASDAGVDRTAPREMPKR